MADGEVPDFIHNELAAIRLELMSINKALGSMSATGHQPAECELKGKIVSLETYQRKWQGAIIVMVPLLSLISAIIVAYVSRLMVN